MYPPPTAPTWYYPTRFLYLFSTSVRHRLRLDATDRREQPRAGGEELQTET